MIPEMYEWVREIGGYFRRWRGGALSPWVHDPNYQEEMDLEARATLAFFEVRRCILECEFLLKVSLQVDRHLTIEQDAKACGATASVAILQSLDAPAMPFFASKRVALTVAHCGWAYLHAFGDFTVLTLLAGIPECYSVLPTAGQCIQ